MIVSDLKLPIHYEEADLFRAIRKKLKNPAFQIRSYELVKRSIDARKKPLLYYVLSVAVNEPNPVKKRPKDEPAISLSAVASGALPAVVIVGSGPAGLFTALKLLRSGVPVTVLERGDDVDSRTQAVERFFKTGRLDPESNVQFGEGGAGTFSDGKLNTGTHRGAYNEEVLRTFFEFGAGEEILYDAKPHIGTDVLREVIRGMRLEILKLGGQVRFRSKLCDVVKKNGELVLTINGNEEIKADYLVLAIGHSARDTFEMLLKRGLLIEPKPFAVGVRIEHLEEDITSAQYGRNERLTLGPASYKLTGRGIEERGVYSFCMCPGGTVVNSSSEPGMLAINGMSNRKRDGVNSNSAIVVQVRTSDFSGSDPLSGIRFQRELEERAYKACQGAIPVQRFQDFVTGRQTERFGRILPSTNGDSMPSDLNRILPRFITESLKKAIPEFARSIRGFDDPDSILSAVESRTSSPVRLVRSPSFESSVSGIYPVGEGAGYAGGIVSSASDGLRAAEMIIQRIKEQLYG